MRSSTIVCALLGALLCSGVARVHADEAASAAAISGNIIKLNSASEAELERLPGIGPARARAIVALRTRLTRFTHVEQLLRVKGIGRATFRKLRPLVAID